MTIDFASDPVLRLRRQQAAFEPFRAVIAAAVERHPGTAESAANEDEALAVLEEARAAQLPTVDLNVTSYRVLARDFSNDQFNIIERSRPRQRTDAILSAQQILFDFGATARRITAAGARLRAAGADLEVAADRVALGAVAAWYDVFAYRALVMLTDAFIDAGDNVVTAVTLKGKGPESGVEVSMRIYQVWTLRDSKVVRVVGGYRDRAEALEAAGLSE